MRGSTLRTVWVLGVAAPPALAAAVLLSAIGTRASGQPGVRGRILTAEGRAASEGAVRFASPATQADALLDRAGEFHVDALSPGWYDMYINVPGQATSKLRVEIPDRVFLVLPPIRVWRGAHARVRVLAPSGEPVADPRILWQSYEVSGIPVRDPFGARATLVTDAEGVTSIGPLPRGVTVLTLDPPPFGRTRLPDAVVTGAAETVDLGVVKLEPGLTLESTVVDLAGTPLVGHEVTLDDGMAFQPLEWLPLLTDANGRARFERVGRQPGLYKLRTRSTRLCGPVKPSVEDWVDSSTSRPVLRHRLLADGVSVSAMVSSMGAPLAYAEISLVAETSGPPPPAWLRDAGAGAVFGDPRFRPLRGGTCTGTTNGEGRATLRYVPPGPARARVGLPNSTWTRRVSIPERDAEVLLDVPPGMTALRLVNASTGAPVTGASIAWSAGGNRVEATTPPSGDVLLEGVSDGPGALRVTAQGYQAHQVKFSEPPAAMHTIELHRISEVSLRCQVVSQDGTGVPGAVVELVPGDPFELTRLFGTDAAGAVRFWNLPAGTVRLTASAPGHLPSSPITLTLPAADPVVLRIERSTDGVR